MTMMLFGHLISEIIGIAPMMKVQAALYQYVCTFTVYTKGNKIPIQSQVFKYPDRHESGSTIRAEQDCLTWQLEYCDYYISIYDQLHDGVNGQRVSQGKREEDLKPIFRLQNQCRQRKEKLDQIVLTKGGN